MEPGVIVGQLGVGNGKKTGVGPGQITLEERVLSLQRAGRANAHKRRFNTLHIRRGVNDVGLADRGLNRSAVDRAGALEWPAAGANSQILVRGSKRLP